MAWKFLFVTGYKPHYCHPDLHEDLKDDLLSRGDVPDAECDEELSSRLDEKSWCDQSGMVLMDEPNYSADCGDGDIWETRVRCFDHYLHRLEDLEPRRFASGKEYYKIHGWMQCVVFTPAQRDVLLAKMREDKAAITLMVEALFARWKRIIADISASQFNASVPSKPLDGKEWN